MVVGAPHVERIAAFEAKYDPILIVDAQGVEPSQSVPSACSLFPGGTFKSSSLVTASI